MSTAEQIEKMRDDASLDEVRKQADRMKELVKKQSGGRFNFHKEPKGFDISKKFLPVHRGAMFKSRSG